MVKVDYTLITFYLLVMDMCLVAVDFSFDHVLVLCSTLPCSIPLVLNAEKHPLFLNYFLF